jgi:hypothetical protein
MYKKSLTYETFDGVEVTEVFRFNFTPVELTDRELDMPGGMQKYINDIIEAKDNREMVRLFKELLIKSYGVISEDGRRFIKNDELREEFKQTNAYSELFMLFATNEDEASKFINGILPKKLVEQAEKQKAETTVITDKSSNN